MMTEQDWLINRPGGIILSSSLYTLKPDGYGFTSEVDWSETNTATCLAVDTLLFIALLSSTAHESFVGDLKMCCMGSHGSSVNKAFFPVTLCALSSKYKPLVAWYWTLKSSWMNPKKGWGKEKAEEVSCLN